MEMHSLLSTMGMVVLMPLNFRIYFNGLAGPWASVHAAEHLHESLFSSPAYHKQNYRNALKEAFLRTDEEICGRKCFFHCLPNPACPIIIV